ncbi:PREDICTED: F-box protein At1g11270-like [Camelina sativa]|uniref:F-box protein At1g11270-like n=1 Tax=Camelina sativa TaxID=90675 RepID=A0ABM0X5Q3_CAMSA|nr:PREDICTED: F-box protein At1g11270-like [Camelina sativa]
MPKRNRDVDDIISNPSIVELPQDVVGEILEKLPVKSLLRFKAVSKLWRREIESRRFQKRHLRHEQKSRDPSILVCHPRLDQGTKLASLRTLSLGAASVSFETHTQYPVDTTIRSYMLRNTRSCDGLTCIYSETFMYVVNPTTRWYRRLPEARCQAFFRDTKNQFLVGYPGFGKDNITGIYKLVWLYNSHCVDLYDGQTNTCEIFSFDTNNTWRYDVIVSSPHPMLRHKVPAHAHGSLHWFIDAVTETQVLAFDLHTETFTVMANIPVAHAPHPRISMCTLNDRLCLSEDKGDTQTIWSLNQDNMTWHKTFSINLRATLSCIEEEYIFPVPPVTSLFNNRLLLYDESDNDGKFVIYNYRLNSYGEIFNPRYLGGAISFSESLITLP